MNKKPLVAALLSLLLAGAGQMYNRDFLKGIILLLAAFTLYAASSAIPTFLLVGVGVWVFSIYDAYTRALVKAHS